MWRRPSSRSSAAPSPGRISSASRPPTRRARARCARSSPKARCRSWPTSISTTSAPSRRPRRGRPACGSIPATSATPSAWREVVKAAKDHGCSIRIGVNAGSLEKHLLEKYGEPCPDAMVESGLDHIKLLQDNDFHEFKISVKASRRVPGRRRLSAAGRGDRCADPSGHHRGGRADVRHGQVGHRAGQPAVDGDRRHDPRLAVRRSGGRGEGRLRDPEVAGPAAPGGDDHLLPVLRAAGVRRDQDRRARWKSGWRTSPPR